MSRASDIWNGFCAVIDSYASAHSPALPVAYEGIDFDPPDNGIWLSVRPHWSGGADLGMEAGSDAYDMGVIAVLVYGRQGVGIQDMQGVAEDVQALFPIRSVFGTAYTEHTPEIRGPRKAYDLAGQYMIVDTRWRAIR